MASIRKYQKSLLSTLVAMLIISASTAGSIFTINYIKAKLSEQKSSEQSYTTADLEKAEPDFDALLPVNSDSDSLGGWSVISPPGKDRVYAYVDRIDQTQINVSQQPLPEELKEDTDKQLENMAVGFNATEVIKIEGIDIYIGTSTDGPQSVIFVKNNLLIMIKSSAKISNDNWVKYITSLN